MYIFLDPTQELSKDIHLIGLYIFFNAIPFTSIQNLLHLFLIIEASHIAGVQDRIQILDHLLVNYLVISE
jgi:hypothetical protein